MSQLILQAFALNGLQTQIFKGKIAPYKVDDPLYQGEFLNTPVFSNLFFKPMIINGVTYTFPKIDVALFTVTQSKHVVQTPIQGGVGDVIEYIGMGNFNINIKGVINGKNGQRPKDTIAQMNKFLAYFQSLEIISDFINNEIQYFVPDYTTPNSGRFEGVNDVVVTRYELPQEEGSYSYQKFEIDCVSDRPVELIING